jgi:hypothetical protein
MTKKRTGIIAAVATCLLLLLAACSTTGGGPTPSTIDGTLVGLLGMPVVGATVTIGTTSTTSDAAGNFSIDNVTPPYDVTVSNTAANWAHVFVGLTSTSPTLQPAGAFIGGPPSLSTATITGTVTTGTTIDSTHPVEVCLEGVSVMVLGCDVLSSPGSYSINANWASTANVAVRVHALQMIVPSSGALPTGYVGYGVSSSTTTMVPGGSYSRNVSVGAVPGTSTLAGTITAPSGTSSTAYEVYARISPRLAIPLGSDSFTGTSAPYSATVPAIGGASYNLLAVGSTSSTWTAEWKVALTAGTGRDLTLAAVPTATVPSSAGPGDTFTVNNTAGSPLTVVFGPTSSSEPTLVVTTGDASVTMPSVLPITSGSTYTFNAIINPGESLTQASSDWFGGYFNLFLLNGAALTTDGGFAAQISGGPTFTVP